MASSRELELKSIFIKNNIYYPQNIEEIKKIILYASDNSLKIRTLGSQHSPSAAIFDEKDTSIKIILDGELRKISEFKIDESENSATVHVGAGSYLGVNPRDDSSSLDNSFLDQIYKKGFALPTLGGITHQTIGGFLSTSSSGGTAKHTIADSIEEIGFIDGTGKYRTAKNGDALFNAVGVSMGLLGIITDIKFKLVKNYLVEGNEINQEIKESCLSGDKNNDYSKLDKLLFEDNEYAHINWFSQKKLNRISLWTGHSVSTDIPKVEYKHALNSKIMTLLASDVLLKTNILNETAGNSEAVQKIIAAELSPFVRLQDHQEFCDDWQKALPIDDQAPVDGLISTSFSELWFPRSEISNVITRCKDLLDKNPKAAGNLIIEFYAAKKSPFWLSPSYGHDAFRMDLYWWDHNLLGNANQYFGQFYEKFHDVPNLRYHWGKHLPHIGDKYGEYTFQPKDIQKNYPKMDDFMKIRQECDPNQIFVTPYLRNLLSIPPLESSFEFTSTIKSKTLKENLSDILGMCLPCSRLLFFAKAKQNNLTPQKSEELVSLKP